MPENDTFFNVRFPDGHSEQWKQADYDQYKDDLFKEFKDAEVTRLSTYMPDKDTDALASDQFQIAFSDGHSEVWGRKDFDTYKDDLMKEDPTAKILKASNMSQQYWGPKAQEAESNFQEFKGQNQDFIKQYEQSKNLADSLEMDGVSKSEYHDFVNANREKYDNLVKQGEELKRQYYTNPLVVKAFRDAADTAVGRRDEYRAKADSASSGDERRDWKRAAKLQDDIRKLYEAPAKYSDDLDSENGFIDYLKDYTSGAVDTFSNKDFYTLGLSKIARNFDLRGIAEKIQGIATVNGEVTPEDIDKVITPSEKAELQSFYELAAAQQQRADNISSAYNAGGTFAESIKFMAEFLASQGLANVAGKALSGSSNALASWLGRQLMSERALAKAIGEGVTTASKGAKAALFAEEFLTRPITQGLFHTATQLSSLEAIADGLLDTDSNGKLVSVGQAVSKSLLDQLVENTSESLGGAVEKTLALPFKGLGWAGEHTIGKTQFGRWARWLYNSAPTQLLKEAGFNGMLGEIGEEWVGNAARVGLGLMSKDEFKDFASWEQQLEMAASFAPLSLFGLGSSTAAAIRKSKNYENLSGQVRRILEKQGRSEDEIEDLFNTRFDTAEDVGKKLAPYLREISAKAQEEGATKENKEDYKTVLEFARELGIQTVMEEVQKLENADKRQSVRENIESVTGRFWQDTAGDENTPPTQSVRVVKDEDGNLFYVTEVGEDGLLTGVSPDGQKKFLEESKLTQDDTIPMEDFLQEQVDALELDEEAQRMEEERLQQINDVRQRVAANPVIPIGTPEAPINATVIAADNAGVQIAWEEDGQQKTDTMSWGQVAASLGTPIEVKSDAELEEEAAEEIDKARERVETYKGITPGSEMVVMFPTGEGEEMEAVPYKFDKAVLEDGQVLFYGQDEEGKTVIFPESMIGNLEDLVASSVGEEATTPFASGETVSYKDEDGNTVKGIVTSEDAGGGYTSVQMPDGTTANVQTARLEKAEEREEEKAPAVAKYTDENGRVNQNAFISNEPEEWAKWNDEQNQDNGADSIEAISAAISELNKSLKDKEKTRKKTSNPDERSVIKADIAQLTERRDRLQSILDGYVAKADAAVAAAKAVETPAEVAAPVAETPEESPAPVAETTEAAPVAEATPEAQEEAAPQTPEQVLESRLAEAKTPEEKRQALEEYYALTATDPTVVGTRADILQRMAELGFSERVIGQVRDQLNDKGELTEGFHIGSMVFIVADDIRDARRARLAHLHEHWHEINRQKGYHRTAADIPGVTTQYLLNVANKMAGITKGEGYSNYLNYPNPQQALADEVIALSMEVVAESTPENVDDNLRDAGLDNQEIINFVKTIYNGERGNDQTLDSSGRDTLSGDNAQEGERQDGGDSASQPEGILGEQGSGSEERSIQGAGEGGLDTSGNPEVTPTLSPAQQEKGTNFVIEDGKLTSYMDAPTGQKSPSAPDETMFSLKREEDSKDDEGKTVPGLRTLADGFLAKLADKPLTPEELAIGSDAIKEMVDYMMPYLDKVKDGKRYLPEEIFGKGWSTIFKNGSYGRTMENTLICMRTLAYNDFVNAVQEKVGRPLTPTESFLASQMLYDIATDPQCLYCYVALDRKAYNGFLKTYIEQRDAVLDKYKADDSIDKTYRLPAQAKSRKNRKALPADNQVNKLYLEYLDGRADTPSMRNRFNGWLDRIAEGTLIGMKDLTSPETRQKVAGKGASYASQIDDAEKYAQSASWAKKQEEYRAYNGELLSMPQKVVDLLNSEYGLRFYSFSEYSPAFIVENMQMVRDAALRGLVGLAYTKEIDFAKIFAPTGININISCYGREAEDGTVVMDTKQGADWGEAQALRERYGNVGCVFVATNDRMVEWAIHQPWVDVVIPFHIVRTGEDIAKFYDWTNYTAMEADKDVKGRSRDIMPTEHMNDKDTFLRLCEERGLKPRFADLILPSTGRSVTEDPDYMKLVNETRRSVNETVRIKPIFDIQEARRSFDEFVDKGGYYAGWFTEEGAFERGVEQVAADVEAGKTAKDVDYGRQDIKASAEKLAAMAGKKKRPRTHQGTPRRIGGDKITKAQQNVLNYLETGEFKSEREPLEVANATQKRPASEATEPVVTEEDVMFRLSKNNKATVESWLKKREDINDEQRAEVVDVIDKLDDAKTQLATAKWFANGTIRIPEDMKKVQQAISVAGKAKVDPLRYNSPMELLDAHADFKPSEERINPDEVSTLHRAAEYPEGIVVYDVDNTKESRENMRKIINTHFGEDASPWCLLQGDGKGNLTADSAKYWRHYNAYPKQVAFKDGKLLAFSANDRATRLWWDRKDESHYGIPVTQKVEGDELGRSAYYIIENGELVKEPGTHLFRGNKQNGVYEEWSTDGSTLLERTNYKNGEEDGLTEAWYLNGQIMKRASMKNGNYVGRYEAWFDNGNKQADMIFTEEGFNDGERKTWWKNGQPRYDGRYKNGKRVGEHRQWDEEEGLESVRYYDEDGEYLGYEEHGQWGLERKVTFLDDGGQEEQKFSRRGLTMSVERTNGKGRLNGLQEQNFIDGTPQVRANYSDGVLDGLRVVYRPNGKLWLRGEYKNGEREGIHEMYDKYGDLISRQEYHNDEKVRELPLDENVQFRKASNEANIASDLFNRYNEQDGENYPWMSEAELIDRIEEELPYGVNTRDLFAKIDEYRRLDQEDMNEGRRDYSGSERDDVFQEILSGLEQIGEENVQFRLSNMQQMDQEFEAAYNNNDEESAQRMVDEMAEAAGYTIRGYHGTTHDFTIFDRSKGNAEGNWGKGFYFTNNEDDAEANYAGEGPDLTNRIELLAENMEWMDGYEDMDYEQRLEEARKQLAGDNPHVISAAIKMENPVVFDSRGGQQETYFDYNENYNEETEEYEGEPTGKLVDFVEAWNDVLSEWEWEGNNVSPDEILEYANYEGLTATQLEDKAREILAYVENSEGQVATGEFLRQVFERMGFDGIVDNNVNQKFGSQRRYGRGMDGVDYGTTHVIAFQPNQIKQADPFTFDDEGKLIPLSKRFDSWNDDIRFRKANQTQNGFISNAQMALDKIKMDKATPEQWVKMLEKEGGMKAGEDKWLGLSDWLKASDKKTLTKDEIGDFIEQNRIQIDEVRYTEDGDLVARELNERYPGFNHAFFIEEDAFRGNAYIDGLNDIQAAIDLYNREHEDKIEWGNYLTDEKERKLIEFGQELLDKGNKESRPINQTRLTYTTPGLDNKREIALTVPTIDPWNEGDQIHFGDAGEGRAVAWIRFGDTNMNSEETKAVDSYLAEMREKYGAVPGEETDHMTEEEIAHLQSLTSSEADATKPRVLVIDEIQSNRHQEGREKGYDTPYREAKKELDENRRKQQALMSSEDFRFLSGFGLIKEDSSELIETPDWVSSLPEETQEKIKEVSSRYKEWVEEVRKEPSLRAKVNETEVYKNGVPAAPFEKNWHELAMKRMLRLAAEEGYDKIAWTTGDQQAERYNLSTEIEYIQVTDSDSGLKDVQIVPLGRQNTLYLKVDGEGNVISQSDLGYGDFGKISSLQELVGKDLAVKIVGSEDGTIIDSDGLRIGGKGMRGFYDDILPKFMNKYGKKWGVKVQDIELPEIGEGGYPLVMHSVDVTPEMKESVMEGQTMFRKRQVTPEQDAEYMDAVNAGDMDKAQQMVREAAVVAGMATNESGKPIDLYHGTSHFGFTTFDTKDGLRPIFTTTRRNVSANYAGDNHYAGVRRINRGYKGATTTEGILEDAESVLGQEWRPVTEEEKQRVIDETEKEAKKVAAEIEKLKDAVKDLPEDGELDIANATAWVEDLFYTVSTAKENGNEGEELYKLVDHGVEKYKENKQVIRDYLDKHYDELDDVQKAYLGYLVNYKSGDVAIDISYSYKDALSGEELATVDGDSFIPFDRLREVVEQAHNIGSYHLYGNLGGNPLVVDAGEKQWYSFDYNGERTNADDLAKYARDNGYSALVIKNVYDYGDLADDYVFFDPNQVKSADPVTYDEDGNVIPLSERFNEESDDIRFSLRGIIGAENAEDEVALDNLEVAEEMENAGKDSPTIWRATGWERGADGKWRNEIPDAKQKEGVSLQKHNIAGEVLDAPELFDSYPELAEMPIDLVNSAAAGAYNREQKRITLDTDYNTKDNGEGRYLTKNGIGTILHELQHAIQQIEGFAKGTNEKLGERLYYKEALKTKPEETYFAWFFSRKNSAKKLNQVGKERVIRYAENYDKSTLTEQDKEYFNKLIDYLKGMSDDEYKKFVSRAAKVVKTAEKAGEESYEKSAGEVEARNVERRSTLSDEKRQKYSPEATEEYSRSEQIVQFRKVTDPATLERLESEPTIKVYRAMQEIDGQLYPPMAAKVEGKMQDPIELGVWEEAVERPDLVDAKGYFTLNKGNGKSIKARYNPYIHTSRSPLNDQFTSAYDRPNLVTVEVEVPESELTSGYKAEKAKDSVGEMTWHAGPVSSKLPEEKSRKVILSRWDKPIRIVPDSEVADRIAELLEGEDIAVPYNTVTPSLREELEKRGVQISDTPSGKVKETEAKEDVLFRRSQDLFNESREGGLTRVIGDENATELYHNVYRAIPKEIRERIVNRAGDRFLFSEATRDAIAEAVENGDPTGLAGLASNMLRDYVGPLDERTARYILWRGDRKVEDDDLLDTVNDIAMQRRLKVGRFAEQPMFRRSPITPKQDREYLDAVESGDMDKAQQMVNEAAKLAMPNTKVVDENGDPLIVYHGTQHSDKNPDFFIFNLDRRMNGRNFGEGFYFTDSKELGEKWARRFTARGWSGTDEYEKLTPRLIPAFLNIENIVDATTEGLKTYRDLEYQIREAKRAIRNNGQMEDGMVIRSLKDGYDIASDVYIAYRPNQIKSAEPVTYDDNGNVVPLSERFNPDSEDIRFRLGEEIEEAENRAESMADDAQQTKDEKKEFAKVNDALTTIKAMSLQKEYDRKTVNTITVLAKNVLKDQSIETLSRHEIARLLGIITTSIGKAPKTVKKNADALVGLIVDHLLRSEETKLGMLVKIKATKIDKGVEKQAALDVRGQNILKAYKKGLTMDLSSKNEEDPTIESSMADAQDRMESKDEAIRAEAEAEYEGLALAKEYKENINNSKNAEDGIDNELKNAAEQLRDGKISRTAYNQFVEEANRAIRENRIKRIEAYQELRQKIGDIISGSKSAAALFREEEKKRIEDIHHLANSDMQGLSFDENQKPGSEVWNGGILGFVTSPLRTMVQMMKLFGMKSVDGMGYLYNKFVRGFADARNEEINGYRESIKELDNKVSEVFDEDMKWSDLYREEEKMPKIKVKWWSGGEKKEFELNQGKMLYIYMVNKMSDGRMKLRRMGITQEDVERITREIDPRLIEIADWLQDEFLVNKRNKYNKIHKRLFGASMASIEDYFPLVVNKRSLNKTEEVGVPQIDALPSTTTGAIIKRTLNANPLDLLNADAFYIAQKHVEQMEHWAAFAELNRDFKTLLSYKRFRNQVQNMNTIYGTGPKLWERLKDTIDLAVGAYSPKGGETTAISTFGKGFTAAKITFRINTALKQLLSMPAFLADASPKYFAENLAAPWKAWKWSMENLPMLQERWKSRFAGDTRLMDTESDWRFFQTRTYEWLSKYGMAPNAFVDALACSIGAHAIYQTKHDKYIKDGYSEEIADQRAKQDAEILYNETQQSNEGAFVSALQKDRDLSSVAFSVYRNSSMGYQRKLHEAIRNFGRRMKPGFKAASTEFMKKQMMRDGLTEEQAEHAAERRYQNQLWHDAVQIGVFGFMLQFMWHLADSMWYLLFGDDDDKKKAMWEETFRNSLSSPVEGLAGGQIISEVVSMIANGDAKNLRNYDPSLLPIIADLKRAVNMYSYDKVAFANEMVNLAAQAITGANLQTLTDTVVAVIDACGGDMETSREAMLLIMRVLQVPQSQIDQIYIDELGVNADKARSMSYSEMAERYARYKMNKNTPLTGWAYSDEAEEKREKAYLKKFKTMVKERKEINKPKDKKR